MQEEGSSTHLTGLPQLHLRFVSKIIIIRKPATYRNGLCSPDVDQSIGIAESRRVNALLSRALPPCKRSTRYRRRSCATPKWHKKKACQHSSTEGKWSTSGSASPNENVPLSGESQCQKVHDFIFSLSKKRKRRKRKI